MKKLNFEPVKKAHRKNVIGLFVCLALIIVGICLCVVGTSKNDEVMANAKSFSECFADGNLAKGTPAYIDAVDQLHEIGHYENDEGSDNSRYYYFAIDEEGEIYIIQATKGEGKTITNGINNDGKYRIEGTIRDINDDQVLDSAYEFFESDITRSYFDEYFQGKMLDVGDSTGYMILVFFGTFMAIIGFVTIIFVIVFLAGFYKPLKKLSDTEIEELDAQLDMPSTIVFDKLHTYVTKDYLVTCNDKLQVVPIKDIRGMEVFIQRYYYIFDTSMLKVTSFEQNRFGRNKLTKMATTTFNIRSKEDLYFELIDAVRKQPAYNGEGKVEPSVQ